MKSNERQRRTGQSIYQKCSHANQLQLRTLDLLELQVAIDQVDREIKSLGYASELLVHLDLFYLQEMI